MSCINCDLIYGCKAARVAYTCDSFEYTSLIASREALVKIVSEAAAITALRKQKKVMAPEHPNTTMIKELVNTGNLQGLDELQTNLDIQLPFLVMAASHLTGDSTKVGAMLRNQKDKRAALVSLLKEISAEVVTSLSAQPVKEETQVEESAVVVEEEKPKRKRRRRTKAQIAADKAAEEAQQEGVEPVATQTAVPELKVDFDRAFNDILSAIEGARQQQADALKQAFDQAGSAMSTSEQRFDHLADRLDRISSALVALEDQLLLTGMILEPAVRKCFSIH